MNTDKETYFDEDCSCNSAMIVAEGREPRNPRLSFAEWSDVKHIGRHGVYSIYTASRYGRKYFLKALKVEVPVKPSESAIKAVWDKAMKDIEPQIKFYATFDFPD